MKKRILALLLCALVVVTSVPATPVSDLFSVQAVAANVETLQSVFASAPGRSEWGNYVNGSSLESWYELAEVYLANSDGISQDKIDRCTEGLRTAIAGLQPYATGITLNKNSGNVAVGKNYQLIAGLSPAGAGGEVSWSSSHSAYVSVNASGLVSANRYTSDTVTITASVKGKGGNIYSATCSVNVVNPVAGITLSPSSLALYEGEIRKLTTKITGMDSLADPTDDVIYTWDSTNPAVATVDDSGNVTAKSKGSTVISVNVRNTTDATSFTAYSNVTVSEVVKVQYFIADSAPNIVSGQTKDYGVSVYPANASIKKLKWTTSSKDIIAVSDSRVEDGKAVITLTAGNPGTAKLTYTATDGSGVSGEINITVKPKITKLTLIGNDGTAISSKAITLGSTGERIRTVILPADAGNQVLDWSSDNQKVCKVDYNGVLTPVGIGKCTITAATKDGSNIKKTCEVIVCEPAQSIVISAPSGKTVDAGKKINLIATVTTTDGYVYNNAKWTSADTSIATVDQNGVVTGVAPGSVSVKAEAVDGSGKSAICIITVVQKITGLSLKEKGNLAVGKSGTLVPTITPANATERNLVWSTSNSAVATVNAEGLVTGRSVGTARITCSTADGRLSATCVVSVIVPATGITINSDSEQIWKGNVVKLVAVVTPSSATNKSVTWTSSNTKVATVTSDGLVTAIAGGECIITAKNSAGQTDTCRIKVLEDCTGVQLGASVKSMYVGQSYTMPVQVLPSTATNKAVTWSSSNTSVATVSTAGVIKALKEGSAVITVKTQNGGFTAKCTVTVYGKVSVTGLSLDRRSVTVPVGVIDQLVATISPSNASERGVTWSCDNSSVLAIDQKGRFKGLKAGTAILTATSVDGRFTDQCRITVTQPVTGVRITTTDVKLAAGKSKALAWSVFPSDATNKKVTWKSSNTAVATVTSAGVVTGRAAGVTVISVTTADGGFTSTCNFTVYVPVTGVQINTTGGNLAKGNTYLLSAIISPSNATNKAVSWSSSNSSIVKVNEAGQVTGVSVGTATVTCKTADGAYKATCTITVYQLAEKVTLDVASVSFEVGKTKTLTAKVTPSTATYKTVTWSSSNKKVATVDANGVVKAVSAGTATITATSKDKNAKATCKVTVIQPVTGVKLNTTSGYVRIGKLAVLKATVLPSNASNQKVTWTSSDTSKATVTADGVVKGISQGYVNITAKTANGGYTATCRVLVVKSATGVKLDKASITINVGKTSTITPTVLPTDATIKTVTWTSSNYDVANVDATGKVIAIAPGYAVITAKTKDGSFTATTEVLVIQPVTGVKLNKTSSYLNLNASMTLVPTVSPENASIKSVTWSSSNPSIATVSSSGVVTGIKKGTVTITCKTTNGAKTASCKISVVKRVTGVSMNKEEAILYFGRAMQLSTTIYPLDASVKDVTFSSTDSNIASVSATGVVTPINTGSTYIVATTKDGGYKAYCKVMVGKAPESVKLSTTSATMLAGKSGTLKYTVYPTDARNRVATFTSSNTDVVTVSSTGVVTAVAKGTANITVAAENGVKAVCKITVLQSVKGIEISSPLATVYAGENITLTAKVLPLDASNQNIIWSSSDSTVAVVSTKGVVSGIKAGVATITATSEEGSFTAACTVTVNQHVTGVEFVYKDVFINKGEESDLRLSVLPYDATDKTVTFESSDPDVVEVTADGHIYAHLGGKATITATSIESGVKGICYVTVNEPVSGIIINLKEKTIFVGESFDGLVPTVYPSDATNKLVRWSSDSEIASVNSDGVVTALKSGTVKITATTVDGAKTASCTFTFLQRATELTVDKTEIKFNRGTTYQLNATVLPEDCYDKSYEWTSADESIATVDETGLVTGVAPGEVVLTCTSKENSEVKATVKVTVHEPVTVIALNEKPAELYTPLTWKAEAVITPENASDKSVTWTSSDEEIATVSQDGTVTALKSGEVTITVTSNDTGLSDFCKINIRTGVESITTEKDEYTFHENTEPVRVAYTVNPEDAYAPEVNFESSNEDVFTVDGEGNVTGVSLGEGILTITSVQNPEVTKTVKINVTRAVSDIILDITEKAVFVGESFTLNASLLPEDATYKTVTWSSSDEAVATVNENGEVTAVSRGTATITAKAEDGGLEAVCEVEVIQLPVEVTFDAEEYKVNVGETLALEPTVLPENTNDKTLTWKSSDEEIATVEDGVVTPVKAGTCEITAYSVKEGVEKTVTVTVIQLAEEIIFPCRISDLYPGERLRVFAEILPADTTDKSFTWSSSDEKVATVDEYGVITAVAGGDAQIIATSSDEGGVKGIINLKVVEKISGIKLDKSTGILEIGEELELVAEVLPAFAYDKTVKFESSQSQVASVDESGKVTALAVGKTTITASTADGQFTATSEITVVKYPEAIELYKTEYDLLTGEREKIEYSLSPEDITETAVVWKSSDEGVATVSSEGIISAVGKGTASITVSVVGKDEIFAVVSVVVDRETDDEAEDEPDEGGTEADDGENA